jgi:DNA-binding FadR family transcriptional regulator
MEKAIEAMEAAGSNLAAVIGPEQAFHRAILQATGNEMFRSLGNIVEMALTIALRVTMSNPAAFKHSLPLHKTMLKAIRRGDAGAARKAAILVIDLVGRNARGEAQRAKRTKTE